MLLRRIAYRLRRPAIVLASVAAATGSLLPVEANAPQPELAMRRVVATPVPVPVFTPVELTIEKIGLKAPIVPVGTAQDGTMESPRNAVDIGWWLGRRPGEGNALFAAHRDWSGRAGSFARLKDLEPGDEIVVQGKGKAMTYRVVWLKPYDRNIDASDLLGNESGKQIATLITCDGVFDTSIGTSLQRLVARAELVA